MKKRILYCPSCDLLTLNDKCSKCNANTINPVPAKYSLEDKYGKYRRLAKSGQT